MFGVGIEYSRYIERADALRRFCRIALLIEAPCCIQSASESLANKVQQLVQTDNSSATSNSVTEARLLIVSAQHSHRGSSIVFGELSVL